MVGYLGDLRENLFCLRTGQASGFPLAFQKFQMIHRMLTNSLHQLLHLSQNALSKLFRALFTLREGHFHAEFIHLRDQVGRLAWHTMTQTDFANSSGGFHEGTGRISEQQPIDRVMNVRGNTSTVKVALTKPYSCIKNTATFQDKAFGVDISMSERFVRWFLDFTIG